MCAACVLHGCAHGTCVRAHVCVRSMCACACVRAHVCVRICACACVRADGYLGGGDPLHRRAHARGVDECEHVVEAAVLSADEPTLGALELHLCTPKCEAWGRARVRAHSGTGTGTSTGTGTHAPTPAHACTHARAHECMEARGRTWQVGLPWQPILFSMRETETLLSAPESPLSSTSFLGTRKSEIPLVPSGAPAVVRTHVGTWAREQVRSHGSPALAPVLTLALPPSPQFLAPA